MGTPAKVLAPGDVRRLETHVAQRRQSARNRVMIMLSFKAGLRACEISGLDWSMVLLANGRVGSSLIIDGRISKNGRARRLPMHDALKAALESLHAASGRPTFGPVVLSQRGGRLTARSIVNWFKSVYDDLGLHGCSSHSGRRTFITQSARLVARAGGSLRDIQELAGHRAITTTERYIEGGRDAQRKLVVIDVG